MTEPAKPEQQTRGIEMNAIPYDRPEEEWDSYQDGIEGSEQEFAVPGRPRRQWFNRKSAALFAVLLGAIGFYAGVRVEKSQVSNSSSSAGALGAGGGAAALRAAAARGGAAAGTGATGSGAAGSGAAGASGSGAASRTGAGAGGGSGLRGLFGGGAGGFAGGGATFGTVSSISGDNLYITEASGNTVKVMLSSATKVTKNVGVGKKAVRPGDTVVVAGAKNSNGTVSATTLSDTGAGAAAAAGGSGSSSSSSSGSSGSSAVSSLFGGGGG
jgi:hypothetical protein